MAQIKGTLNVGKQRHVIVAMAAFLQAHHPIGICETRKAGREGTANENATCTSTFPTLQPHDYCHAMCNCDWKL